ncbi:hypothetical protein TPAR_06610 [Tolypocladium paradoxum]|uniref:Uncharacterized protein n=1 Tax=Tolypocladium paradoxum TaxID=94208 RepID=A0A2S4KSL3_9HYPO|nr:hypothetical protein TPAR_06610 [Tolypocladium paradoxum]
MLGLEERNEPPKAPRDALTVKNREPQRQAQRNHMKTVLAWISRQRFSLSLEPKPIQLEGRLSWAMLPQSMACSLAARTMALTRVKRTPRMSRGSMMMGRASEEKKAAARP